MNIELCIKIYGKNNVNVMLHNNVSVKDIINIVNAIPVKDMKFYECIFIKNGNFPIFLHNSMNIDNIRYIYGR